MRKKATPYQRILAAIIDFVIIICIGLIIKLIISKIVNSPEVPAQIQDYIDGKMSVEAFSQWIQTNEFTEYSNALMKANIPTLISYIVLFVVYLVVVPYFWSKQTIGRLLMKIKVVYDIDDKPTLGNLLAREVIGVLLVGILNCCCCIPFIINIVLLFGKDARPIHDSISSTTMVMTDEFEDLVEPKEEEQDYVIDAEIVDTK